MPRQKFGSIERILTKLQQQVRFRVFCAQRDLAAILKRYCCHDNVTYKFILTTIRLLTCSSIQIDLLNYSKE